MSGSTQLLQALIYRNANGSESDITCDGCAEDLATLIENSPSHHINVTFVGPNDRPLNTPDLFQDIAIFVVPGGNSLSAAWEVLEPESDTIRAFVANGGRYIGVCLGAYLAGPSQGFNLMAAGNNYSEEIFQPGNPTGSTSGNETDMVAEIAWNYQTGVNQSHTYEQYAFFQDGAAFLVPNTTDTKVLGTYVSNGNISATLNPFGLGWVGLIGIHPEADETWYVTPNADHNFTNPSGIQFDIGWDFINATLNGANPNSTFVSNVPYTNISGSATSFSTQPAATSSSAAAASSSAGTTSAAGETSSVSLLLLLITACFWVRTSLA